MSWLTAFLRPRDLDPHGIRTACDARKAARLAKDEPRTRRFEHARRKVEQLRHEHAMQMVRF